jgi:hypothetical protein
MVEKEPTQEFTMSGLEATTLKAWRNSRDALALPGSLRGEQKS